MQVLRTVVYSTIIRPPNLGTPLRAANWSQAPRTRYETLLIINKVCFHTDVSLCQSSAQYSQAQYPQSVERRPIYRQTLPRVSQTPEKARVALECSVCGPGATGPWKVSRLPRSVYVKPAKTLTRPFSVAQLGPTRCVLAVHSECKSRIAFSAPRRLGYPKGCVCVPAVSATACTAKIADYMAIVSVQQDPLERG